MADVVDVNHSVLDSTTMSQIKSRKQPTFYYQPSEP